ncbi:hypothetical protein JCM19236_5028 [Vibrio sp. JCM 19236]|nr:hypothetical protein JCM19236_5028 [Vibrio sp. JCM 19236]
MNKTLDNKFGVEHALDMYANSFVTLPAEAIYEKQMLQQYKSVIDDCHIYVIGTCQELTSKVRNKLVMI